VFGIDSIPRIPYFHFGVQNRIVEFEVLINMKEVLFGCYRFTVFCTKNGLSIHIVNHFYSLSSNCFSLQFNTAKYRKSLVFLGAWFLTSFPICVTSSHGNDIFVVSNTNQTTMFDLEFNHLMGCAEIELSQESCLIQNVISILPSSDDLLNLTISTPLGNFSAQELYISFNSYLDTNGDGTVSQEEIYNAKPSFDLNQDGLISLEDLAVAESFIKTMVPYIVTNISNETTFLNQSLVEKLEIYDLDGDGIFSNDEIENGLEVLTTFFHDIYPSMGEIVLQVQNLENIEGGEELLNALDFDSDGQFNVSDIEMIQSIVGDVLTNMSVAPQLNNITSVINAGNSLDKEEILSNLELFLQEATANLTNVTIPINETVMEIFSTLDVNGDGNITGDEFEMLESMLISMYDSAEYQGPLLSVLEENSTIVDSLDVENFYTAVMNNTFISEDEKEMLASAMDLDENGIIAAEDFNQGAEILFQIFNPNKNNVTDNQNKRIDDYESTCGLPFPDDALAVEIAAGLAFSQCNYSGAELDRNETEHTMNNLHALLNASECIDILCEVNTQKEIVIDWLESCTDMKLPSAEHRNEPSYPELGHEQEEDLFLSCMFDFALTLKPENLDVPELSFKDPSATKCTLPGLSSSEQFCSSTTGPQAIDACIHLYEGRPSQNDDVNDDFFDLSYNYQFSYSYSYNYNPVFDWFEMSYDYEHSYNYNYGDDQLLSLDQYKEKLCSILTHLSSNEGKECLLPVCDSIQNFEFAYNEEDVDFSSSTIVPSPTFISPPSAIPTVIEETSGTGYDINVPSFAPSHHSSLRPSPIPEFVKSVEVKFQAKISFENLNKEDIPQEGPEFLAMVQVLENALSQNLPDGSSARIIKIAGILVSGLSRRRLDDTTGVEIEFEVTKTISCDGNDCNLAIAESNTFYSSATNQLNSAISTGLLETSIEEEASILGLVTLQSIEVDTESFVASSLETKVVTTQGSSSPTVSVPQSLPSLAPSLAPTSGGDLIIPSKAITGLVSLIIMFRLV